MCSDVSAHFDRIPLAFQFASQMDGEFFPPCFILGLALAVLALPEARVLFFSISCFVPPLDGLLPDAFPATALPLVLLEGPPLFAVALGDIVLGVVGDALRLLASIGFVAAVDRAKVSVSIENAASGALLGTVLDDVGSAFGRAGESSRPGAGTGAAGGGVVADGARAAASSTGTSACAGPAVDAVVAGAGVEVG